MPHQGHKDVKGKPQENDIHERAEGQSTGTNVEGQRAYNQQSAKGTLDQASEPARPNLMPETRKHEKIAEPTARAKGDLEQTRAYEKEG